MTSLVRPKILRLGTRSSPLARYQTEKIISALKSRFPEERFETRLFQSLGDRDQDSSLEVLTKKAASPSIFADEIEKALRSGEIDAAVHSLKDLSVSDQPDLCLAALPEREDARDALVSARGWNLARLPKGARIGTCSLRRSLQLLTLRPDLRVVPVRGTVEARLKKMEEGEYEGLILAVAGLHRLGLHERISEYFSPEQMLPAPGQGALAVQCRRNDTAVLTLLSHLDDKTVRACVETERSFLKTWGLDYDAPIAAWAEFSQEAIVLHAAHLDFGDSHRVVRTQVKGKDPMAIAREVKSQIEATG